MSMDPVRSCVASQHLIAENHMATLHRHCGGHLSFQVTAGNQARVDDVSAVILPRLPDIDQRKLGISLQQRVKVRRCDFLHLG